MSASADLIGNWASGLWIDLGQPVNVSALTISGYAVEPSTVGRLNNFISTCFSGSGFSGAGSFNYDISPPYGQEELAIIGTMYLVSYYNGLANSTMGYGGDSIPFTSLAEGDTKLGRANAASIGTVYANMAKESQAQLKYLVNVYINQSQGADTARDVEYYNIVYPTWGAGYRGG